MISVPCRPLTAKESTHSSRRFLTRKRTRSVPGRSRCGVVAAFSFRPAKKSLTFCGLARPTFLRADLVAEPAAAAADDMLSLKGVRGQSKQVEQRGELQEAIDSQDEYGSDRPLVASLSCFDCCV